MIKWNKVNAKPKLPPAKRVTDWIQNEQLYGYYVSNHMYDFPNGTVQYYDLLVCKVNGETITNDKEVITLRGSQGLDRLFDEVALGALVGIKYLGQDTNGLDLEHKFKMVTAEGHNMPENIRLEFPFHRISGRK